MTIPKFRLGDVVQLRKTHPCGDDRWEVVRTGADFRIRCLGCNRLVMLPRRKFERAVKRVLGSLLEGYQPDPPGGASRR
ncbi:MAG TPA: DUF951 domain-containing protein [Bacillota bacterium]